MSMLDLFLTDPTDPAERARAVADIAELRARLVCDCDRCCPTCPHGRDCAALAGGECTECQDDGGECYACGAGVQP